MIIPLTGVLSVVCGYTDFKYRKIFNKITFPSILFGFIYGFLSNGFEGLYSSFLGFLLGLGILLIPFILGGMGAGDVKMLAMVGALTGPIFVLKAFAWGAVLGGVFALYYLFVLKKSRKEYIPYGIPLAIGVLIQIAIDMVMV